MTESERKLESQRFIQRGENVLLVSERWGQQRQNAAAGETAPPGGGDVRVAGPPEAGDLGP